MNSALHEGHLPLLSEGRRKDAPQLHAFLRSFNTSEELEQWAHTFLKTHTYGARVRHKVYAEVPFEGRPALGGVGVVITEDEPYADILLLIKGFPRTAGNSVLRQNGSSTLETAPQIIHFLEGRRTTPNFLTYEVSALVQRVESIAS